MHFASHNKSLYQQIMSSRSADSSPDADLALNVDAASATVSRMNKFDKTNFHTWKFKMQMVLEERDLWKVTSEEIKMDHLTTALEQSTFKRKLHKVLAIICLAMED